MNNIYLRVICIFLCVYMYREISHSTASSIFANILFDEIPREEKTN